MNPADRHRETGNAAVHKLHKAQEKLSELHDEIDSAGTLVLATVGNSTRESANLAIQGVTVAIARIHEARDSISKATHELTRFMGAGGL